MRPLRTRGKAQPPPAHALFEALSNPAADQRRRWLHLLEDELAPVVLRADPPGTAVWSSLWNDRPDDVIRFDIRDEYLTWTLLGEAAEEDEPRLTALHHRINGIVNADLRLSFGQ
jgi:hypothetical protein